MLKLKLLRIYTILIVLSLVIKSTADASETNIYGSVRFATFFISENDMKDTRDKEYTMWELMNDSRVGGKIENNTIKAGFEFGNGHDRVELRKLFATYSFSENLKIKIGKDYTPLNYFPSNQVAPIYENEGDSGLKPYGGIYEGYENMIELSTDRLKIALIEPATEDDDAKLKLGLDADIEKTAPKIEVSYNIGSENCYADFYTGFQTYKLIQNATEVEYDVNSWVLGINVGAHFGPFYALGNAYSGQNINPYGLWADGDDSPRIIGDEIYDCTTDGYIVVLGFEATESTIFETGIGYIVHNLDGAVTKDETFSAYINLQYHVNDMFYVVPEIGIVNYMEDNAGTEEGKKTYAGVKWQIDF